MALILVACSQDDAQPVGAADGLPPGTLAHYVGFNERNRFDDMESALGRPLDRVVTMTGNSSPSEMRSSIYGQFGNSSAYLPDLSDRLDVTVTIPLAFGKKAIYQTSGPEAVLKGLKMTSSGAYDADYRIVARGLIAAGYSDAVLRLGHEFDGTWVQWSARDNEQAYIEAFRHVRNVFAKESSEFRYEWTGMRAPWIAHARKAYPGDAYVDIVGLDIYYRESGEITDTIWNQYKATLTAHRDFAISRGKPVSYPEWGRAFGDTDRFISLMHGWFADLPKSGPGRLEYQSYFNPPHQGGNYDLNNQPTVKRRYLELFRNTSSAATL
ncbi:MAG: glycoside hydrolase family 26 protein, partial [Solirubrobacterales bacterium]